MRNNKKLNFSTREQEISASKFFGKHVSTEKAVVSFIAAFLMAMLPSIVGLRFWDSIPELIITGIRDASGKDDSLPRWAMVYCVPGLFAVLTAICHGQLFVHQKRLKVPPTHIRLLGRWVLPVISVFFCSWAEFLAAGERFSSSLVMQCAIGVALVLTGVYLFDCKKDSFFALPFKALRRSDKLWTTVHRTFAVCWMLAGFALMLAVMLFGRAVAFTSLSAVALVLLPFVIGMAKYS